jgi:hypothetical protein
MTLTDAMLRDVIIAASAARGWYLSLAEEWAPPSYSKVKPPPEYYDAMKTYHRMKSLGDAARTEMRRRTMKS